MSNGHNKGAGSIGEHVLPYTFAHTDATLLEYLNHSPEAFSRRQTSSGSAVFIVRALGSKRFDLVTITLRTLQSDRTLLTADLSRAVRTLDPESQNSVKLSYSGLMYKFILWLHDEDHRVSALAKDAPFVRLVEQGRRAASIPVAAPIPVSPRPQRRRGGQTDKDNDWAREQIVAGRDKEEVFQEYLSRAKLDPASKDYRRSVALVRDRFRKALGRTDANN